jgi:hypothetical protein
MSAPLGTNAAPGEELKLTSDKVLPDLCWEPELGRIIGINLLRQLLEHGGDGFEVLVFARGSCRGLFADL